MNNDTVSFLMKIFAGCPSMTPDDIDDCLDNYKLGNQFPEYIIDKYPILRYFNDDQLYNNIIELVNRNSTSQDLNNFDAYDINMNNSNRHSSNGNSFFSNNNSSSTSSGTSSGNNSSSSSSGTSSGARSGTSSSASSGTSSSVPSNAPSNNPSSLLNVIDGLLNSWMHETRYMNNQSDEGLGEQHLDDMLDSTDTGAHIRSNTGAHTGTHTGLNTGAHTGTNNSLNNQYTHTSNANNGITGFFASIDQYGGNFYFTVSASSDGPGPTQSYGSEGPSTDDSDPLLSSEFTQRAAPSHNQRTRANSVPQRNSNYDYLMNLFGGSTSTAIPNTHQGTSGILPNLVETLMSQALPQLMTYTDLNLNASGFDDVKKIAKKETIENLPTKFFDPNEISSDDICVICQDNFVESDIIKTLPCNHNYHLLCIDKWLSEKSYECPMCKKPVGDHEFKYN